VLSIPEKARITRKKISIRRDKTGRRNAPRIAASRLRAGALRRASGGRLSGNRSTTPSSANPESPAATKAGVARSALAGLSPARSPPSAGPMIKPSPNAAPISPIPLARFSGVVTSAIYACAAAMLPAQMPERLRAANSIHSASAAPIHK